MRKFKVFVVEDDQWYGDFLNYHFSLDQDNEVDVFRGGAELLASLSKGPDLITIDYGLPDMSGAELYAKIRKLNPKVPVIIVSAQQELQVAIDLLRDGVYDYVLKDDDAKDRLWNIQRHLKENMALRDELSSLKSQIQGNQKVRELIKGESSKILKVFELIKKASVANITVSVTGETGTGKELIAKAIHMNSSRKSKKLVAVNVAAIPKELLESELFGHEKGAFTGAVSQRVGKFEEANGGTLFLDEIGELDVSLQAKLLRVLQERELIRVGGAKKVKLDVRLIVATHKNILKEVKEGRFREDLYYRIQGLPIALPPLRERGADIILLAEYFLKAFCKENKIKKDGFSKEAKERLMGYPFPGNIRELKSVVDLAAVLSEDSMVRPDDIMFQQTESEMNFLASEMTMEEYKNKIIQLYLDKYDDIKVVADKLNIGVSTIYRLLQHEKEMKL